MEDITYNKSRVISFSDAIFSIAMTLLVLELNVPSYKAFNELGTLQILSNRIPSFIGFAVSFLVTAIYWTEHMRIMKYVSSIDNKLLWLNMFLLLFIVLMPFSTAFYVQGFKVSCGFIFYTFNLAIIGLFSYFITRYVVKNEKGKTGLTTIIGKWKKTRALSSFIFWFTSGLIAMIHLEFGRFLFLVIFIINPLIDRYYKKKQRLKCLL